MVQKTCLKALVLLVFFSFCPFISAQEEQPVFAPFVSMLEAEIKNNLIRLSWKDAEETRGPVYIYRSETPFSRTSSVSLPVPAEIPYGTGSYLDEADKAGTLYYFVVASDEWGRKYTLSIPYTNTISVSVAPENVPGYSRPSPSSADPSSSRPVPAGIEAFSALVEEDQVIISFSGADRSKTLILYRSINPIRKPEDLLSALIIQRKLSSPFIDYPVPGIPYYYAVIYEEDLGSPLLAIRPGHNTTGEAVEIPPNAARAGSRETPLPRIKLPGASTTPDDSASLSPEAAQAAASLEHRSDRERNREAAAFPEDLIKDPSGGSGGGEEYQLRTIVQGYFSIGDWDKAEEELRQFLELPRKAVNRNKARFYLGQVYYFQGKNREALFEFLDAQKNYPVETAPWIQAVLDSFAQ